MLLHKKRFAWQRGGDLATAVNNGIEATAESSNQTLNREVVIRGQDVLDANITGEVVDHQPVQVYCSTNTSFIKELRLLKNQLVKHENALADIKAVAEIQEAALQTTKTDLQATNTELAYVNGAARALAVSKCQSLANRILLLASKGPEPAVVPATREEKEERWKIQLKSLAKDKQVLDLMNMSVEDFVSKAISIYQERNKEAHPDTLGGRFRCTSYIVAL